MTNIDHASPIPTPTYNPSLHQGRVHPESASPVHYAEVPLKKVIFIFPIPSLDDSTFLCLLLLSLFGNPLILQNTFWSYTILVTLITIFNWQGEPLIKQACCAGCRRRPFPMKLHPFTKWRYLLNH